MKIYLSTDRIKATFQGLSLIISPLTHSQKILIASHSKQVEGKAVATREGIVETIRQAVKGVEGFQDAAGDPLVAEIDESGILTQDFADVLVEYLMGHELNVAAMMIASKRIEELKAKIEGVEIEVLKKSKAS